MQPRLEARRVSKAMQLAPCRHERGLHRVLGECHVPQDAKRDRHASISVRLHQGSEGLSVSLLRAVDERFMHDATPHGASR